MRNIVLILVFSSFMMGLRAQCVGVRNVTIPVGEVPVLSDYNGYDNNLLNQRERLNLLEIAQNKSNMGFMAHFQPFYKSMMCSNMRVFSNMEELFNEINKLASMDEEELNAYEDSIGFMSFGRKSETIYWQILKELGEPFGVEYFGDEEMDSIDVEFTTEDALVYVSQYPEYLEVLMSTISEEGQEDYDIDEFLPKYNFNPFRYVMNENRMFQVEETIYKIFNNYIIGASIDNIKLLFDITETNIDDVIVDIEENGENGSGGIMMYGAMPPFDKESGDNMYEKENPTTPGCSGRTKGTMGREKIYAEVKTSDDKEMVSASFYCLTYKGRSDWTTSVGYSMFSEGRICKKCIWTKKKKILNMEFCMEIFYRFTVQSFNHYYNSCYALRQFLSSSSCFQVIFKAARYSLAFRAK